MAETRKAFPRRTREGFFDKYIDARRVLDVGVGRQNCQMVDPVSPHAFGWDMDNGDATYLDGVADASYDTVYSSHCLEHLNNPVLALVNWWRVLAPGGHLVLFVPHRDLYERRRLLPSRWADGESWASARGPGHKFYVLPDRSEPPHTLSLMGLVNAACTGHALDYVRICDEGYDFALPESAHPVGEYSIELVTRKPA